MYIRSALNGGLCEVDEEFGSSLIASGQWIPADEAPVAPPAPVEVPEVSTPETPAETPTEAPVKKRRIRRTQAQIAADNAAAAYQAEARQTGE